MKPSLLVICLCGVLSAYCFGHNGRKHALLIGINRYPQPTKPLQGTLRDVRRMRWLLHERFGFNVQTMLDEQATRDAIIKYLGYSQQHANKGDVFVFYFSGYGSVVPDLNGDEVDGLDEILCPYDFQQCWEKPLSDDFFKDLLDNWPGQLIIILDCAFCLPGIKIPACKTELRLKSVWPPVGHPLYAQIKTQIAHNPNETGAGPFIDISLVNKRHVLITASRGNTPAFDATFKLKRFVVPHGVLTCCLSSNAPLNITYKYLIMKTIISCTRAGIPQRPVIKCSSRLLNAKIFQPLEDK